MTQRQDDIKANIKRRDMLIPNIDKLKTRMTIERADLISEQDGSGKARNADMAKRTKREVKADLDDTLLCMLKFQAEATQCSSDAKVLLKELERRP